MFLPARLPRVFVESWTTFSSAGDNCEQITAVVGEDDEVLYYFLSSDHPLNDHGIYLPVLSMTPTEFHAMVCYAKQIVNELETWPSTLRPESMRAMGIGSGVRFHVLGHDHALVQVYRLDTPNIQFRDTLEAHQAFLRGLADDERRAAMRRTSRGELLARA